MINGSTIKNMDLVAKIATDPEAQSVMPNPAGTDDFQKSIAFLQAAIRALFVPVAPPAPTADPMTRAVAANFHQRTSDGRPLRYIPVLE